MYRATEGVRVQSQPLPDGDAGTRKTLANMRRLATEGSRDPAVRQAVIAVLRGAGVMSHNVPAQVSAWFEFVRDRIYFLHDPVATEWLQAASFTLSSGAGDCDDRATLLSAGLLAFGVPSSFKVVALGGSGTFSHVYVIAHLPGREPLALDPTYPDNTLGTEPPRATRTWMVPV